MLTSTAMLEPCTERSVSGPYASQTESASTLSADTRFSAPG